MINHKNNLFLMNGGKMGRKVAETDWSSTPLRNRDSWPEALSAAVNICLNTAFPIAIFSGQDFTMLYNDAYAPILGSKHSWALGSEAREVWSEVWYELEEDFNYVMQNGKSVEKPNSLFILNRNGFLEETFFDYTLSPIIDRSGAVVGIFNTSIDTTFKVVSNRRNRVLQLFLEKQNTAINIKEALTAIDDILLTAKSEIRSYEIEIIGRYAVCEQTDQSIRIPFKRDVLQVSGSILFIFPAYKRADDDYLNFLHSIAGYIETLLNNVYSKERDSDLEKLNQDLLNSLDAMAALNEELAAANEEQFAVNGQISRVNQQLSESQDELELAIEAAHLGTWDLDPQTRCFSGNELTKEWFDLPSMEEIPLEVATNLIIPEERERVILEIDHALTLTSGGHYDTYYTIQVPGKSSSRIVRAKGRALFNKAGECIRMSGVLQDVTEIKQDEQRKNDFIAMVSHELKTPLTSMNGYLQIIHNRAEKLQDNFTINMIGKSTRQITKMINLINGFLNVSRLESGKIHIERSHFDLALLIKETEEESIASITSHQVVFAPVEETWLEADRDKIGHVIDNLISNAVKYSPLGSTINVACVTKNQVAYVSVKDQGMGISKKDIPRLFDRFYRVESTNITTISGFGIGLYLCCEIIKRHNGKLWVESEIGKGSTFHFTLPIYQQNT